MQNRYWKNNTTEVKLAALEKIANALHVDPSELIEVIDKGKPKSA